jgi:hypothetical protein
MSSGVGDNLSICHVNLYFDVNVNVNVPQRNIVLRIESRCSANKPRQAEENCIVAVSAIELRVANTAPGNIRMVFGCVYVHVHEHEHDFNHLKTR